MLDITWKTIASVYLCTPPYTTPCIWSPECWLISGLSVGIASHSHNQTKPWCFRIFEKLVRPEIAPHCVAEHSNGFVSIFYFWFCTHSAMSHSRGFIVASDILMCASPLLCIWIFFDAIARILMRWIMTKLMTSEFQFASRYERELHCLALIHLHWKRSLCILFFGIIISRGGKMNL